MSDDLYRSYRLSGPSRDGVVDTVDDVHFDLRHADLDRSAWQPTAVLGSSLEREIYAPRIAFPWTPDETRWALEQGGHYVDVLPGDTVIVATVSRMPIRSDRGDLDHPHHRERRWAHLAVRRGSSERTYPVRPAWEFQGVADVMTSVARADDFNARNALLERLRQALDIEDIEAWIMAGSEDDRSAMKADALPLWVDAAKALWRSEHHHVEEAEAVFGYLVGRAEAEERLLPLAVRQAEFTAGNKARAKAPRKSGNDTRVVAVAVIKRTPTIPRRACAVKVAEVRGLTDVKGVERTIAQLFHEVDGVLRPTPDALRLAATSAGT